MLKNSKKCYFLWALESGLFYGVYKPGHVDYTYEKKFNYFRVEGEFPEENANLLQGTSFKKIFRRICHFAISKKACSDVALSKVGSLIAFIEMDILLM